MVDIVHKGWTYETTVDRDDDVIKIFHDAVRGDERVMIDFSPYHTMTAKSFVQWVDLGMPTRKDLGDVNAQTLDIMWAKCRSLIKDDMDNEARLAIVRVAAEKP